MHRHSRHPLFIVAITISAKIGEMKNYQVLIIVWMIVLWTAVFQSRPIYADFGPLQTSNRFPLHLLFIKPRPVKADLPGRGEFEAALALEYGNTFLEQRNDSWDVLLDMEMMVIDFSAVYGLTSKIAIHLNMPIVSLQAGFLDGFLENYHDALGTSNYGREKRPKNNLGYRIVKDGLLWVQGQEGSMQLADMTISTQFDLIETAGAKPMSGSLLLSLKLPTGDSTRGLGSGRFDAGVYLPVRWAFSPWSLYAMPGAAFISNPDTDGAHISARHSYSLFCGTGYDYSDHTTWLLQFNYYSSPIEETGLDELDQGALELAVGFHHRLADDWLIEFAFCEDLTLAVPDFNLRLGLRWTWPQNR
jgi:hypothetical protein